MMFSLTTLHAIVVLWGHSNVHVCKTIIVQFFYFPIFNNPERTFVVIFDIEKKKQLIFVMIMCNCH